MDDEGGVDCLCRTYTVEEEDNPSGGHQGHLKKGIGEKAQGQELARSLRNWLPTPLARCEVASGKVGVAALLRTKHHAAAEAGDLGV